MQKIENIVEYRGIGAVRYVQNRRAKHLTIRIRPPGEVRVTVPGYVSRRRAERFLFSKQEWVVAKLDALRKEASSTRMPREGEHLLVRGKQLKINLVKGESGPEEALWRLLLEEAQSYLPYRVEELAAHFGFSYSRVRIRKMRSRWGSCNHQKGINLNSWLVMLPDHLSDYVILHELVHTRFPHHGPGFWEALDGVTGGKSKALRRALRMRKIMSIYPENQLGGEGE